MAVNQSRSMSADFAQGTVDSSYISLTPDRGGVLASVPSERLDWPGYEQVERHIMPKGVTDYGLHAGKDIEHLR